MHEVGIGFSDFLDAQIEHVRLDAETETKAELDDAFREWLYKQGLPLEQRKVLIDSFNVAEKVTSNGISIPRVSMPNIPTLSLPSVGK